MAWQFHLADQDRGVVQVFRHTQSPYETATFPLHGLDPAAKYEFTDLDTKSVTSVSGRDLMTKGLRVAVTDRPAAVVLLYRKAR